MPGHKNFSVLREKLRARMTPRQRASHDRDTAREIATLRAEMALADLRKTLDISQVDLAGRMGVSQPALSQLEGQDDMYLSTLHRLIDAMGGKLELLAHLPGGAEIVIKLPGRDAE